MYLVKTNSGDKFLNSVNEVKSINKNEIIGVYTLVEVDYDFLISTSDIRECIYSYLKGSPAEKDNIIEYVSAKLDVKKNEVSKVITAMKKEKIIYVEEDFGWLEID